MKKLFIMLLVLVCIGAGALIALSALNPDPEDPNGPTTGGDLTVLEAAAQDATPSKIVTLTTYSLGEDLSGEEVVLSGNFVQISKGTNSILDYKYERFALPEEKADSYKKIVEGAIAVKDGAYKQLGEEMDWQALIPSLQQIGAFEISVKNLPSDYKLTNNGKTLSVSLTAEEALAVLGVSLGGAQGEISLEVQTNGKYVSQIVVQYAEASGATVRIATSYTYGN